MNFDLDNKLYWSPFITKKIKKEYCDGGAI